MIVYFNGRYLSKDDVRISPDDRGFLFADGIYEVTRAYGGRLFRVDDHIRRLDRSLRILRIDPAPAAALPEIAERLLQANDLPDALVYVQVTRGAAPRNHAFPNPATEPTVYAAVSPAVSNAPMQQDGTRVILVPDLRWGRCDVKSVALLPNVLANQRAHDAGAYEALFVRDGALTEGTHTNVCAVFDGELRTYPSTNYILPGVTRTVVLELCAAQGIPYRLEPFYEHELRRADELMILGTSTEVTPVVQVDDWRVGDGTPGPVTRRLQHAFREATGVGLD